MTAATQVYVLAATPAGSLVDRWPSAPRLYKCITASGFLTLGVSFALLAPIGTHVWGGSWEGGEGGEGGAGGGDGVDDADPLQRALNGLPAMATALALKGVGSALSQAAIYPDLVTDVPDEPLLQATISALWNAAYAVGWAAGPFVGDVLMSSLRLHTLCIDQWAQPPHCAAPTHLDAHAATLVLPAPPPSPLPLPPLPSPSPALPALNCTCDWVPDNGFDGFASTIALSSFAYALPVLIAAALNVRGPSRTHRRTRLTATGACDSVEPLQAPNAVPASTMEEPH